MTELTVIMYSFFCVHYQSFKSPPLKPSEQCICIYIPPPPICAHTHHAYTYSSCIHSNSLPFCIPYLLSQIYYNTTDKHMSTSTLCVHTDTASSQLHSMTACSMKKKCKSQSKNGKTPHAGHKQIKYKSIMRTA